MAELHGIPVGRHLQAIVSEWRANNTICGYPARKMFRGFPGFDFSVAFHGRRAATPLGPASGPHTQLAQNIVLSFLGGGRIIELKTVQIRDHLQIPRPCIDVRNVGYNIEWSQELRLHESYQEYVNAWVLLKLIEKLELLGVPAGDPFYATVFDLSVGYDLAGISSPPMQRWLAGMQNAEAAIAAALETLPPALHHLRHTAIAPNISESVTLSTFHGCPRTEIENIVQHLISTHGFHVIVKMNPTLLGYDTVRRVLHEELGYTEIQLDPHAFEKDLQFEEAVAMMQRLAAFAGRHGRCVGAKFTNTLVVRNHERIFKDEFIYLSGAPLHVLAMQAMQRFREAMGPAFHLSFSAGITKQNFARAVACNLRPVSTCTDLLKTGGYTRLFDYLKNLQQAMAETGSHTIDEFILASAGGTAASVAVAGAINSGRIVATLAHDPQYHAANHRKTPPKIDRHLALFDCITCNKCLPVCPNAANFSLPIGEKTVEVTNYRLDNGRLIPVPAGRFVLAQARQIANLADFCNDCGNCDTYCPETGGPYIEKPRFFFTPASFARSAQGNGFYFATPDTLVGRLADGEYQLTRSAAGQTYLFRTGPLTVEFDHNHQPLGFTLARGAAAPALVDLRPYHILRTLLDGVHTARQVYAALLLQADGGPPAGEMSPPVFNDGNAVSPA
ncbi:MAG: glutamate synthase [candidate division KSB1 bacterium]|nr:glutamate synthase [candidate division KSB1 bacterium]MDZ7276367.1 glutamate synthase [candidate division KSB1 bacterium]MDZ7287681.1 glutamate synthase [candidate division KSB1 bacterium]MDZ7299979.1 glutamate synthase [candidate division KSB1 bacterium]MDZ7307352.1 glutamate synthase [candidate division KSB1 bacterium]